MCDRAVLIRNAVIHDGVGGVLRNADLLLQNGKIAAMGTAVVPPENTQVIKAEGLHILPGFVSPLGCWGGIGPGIDESGLAENSDPVTPEMNVKYAFMVDSMTTSELYRFGITSSCLCPDFSNIFGGMCAVYKTWGTRADHMLLREKAAEAAAISGGVKRAHAGRPDMNTTMGLFRTFLAALHDGEAYDAAAGRDFRREALSEVVSGRVPLLLNVDARGRWESVKRELRAFPHVRCIVNGLYDLNSADDPEILRGEYGAVLGSVADGAAGISACVRYQDIDLMVTNGARIALSPQFTPAEMTHKEALLWNANVFYRGGVSAENVLKMITSIPAALLGVDDRVGRIAPGLDADLTLWTGDPVTSFTAQLCGVFINGVALSEKEKVRVCW